MDRRKPFTLPLSRFQRVVLSTIGIALSVGGVWAVFWTDNELGTLGMLTFGGICLLAAILGKMPVRWRIGEHDLLFAAEALAEGDEERGSQILSLDLPNSKIHRAVFSALATGLEYQDRVIHILRHKARALGAEIETSPIPFPLQFDAVISYRGRTIGVEIRSGPMFDTERMAASIAQQKGRADKEIHAIGVIVNSPVTAEWVPRLTAILSGFLKRFLIIPWSEDSSEEELERQIGVLFHLATDPLNQRNQGNE